MKREKTRNILIMAGEESGDLHGAKLVEELLLTSQDLKIHAFGGPKMARAGAHLVENTLKFSVVGITEVFFNLPEIFQLEKRVRDWVVKNQPILVILIDYPGFHLRLLPFLAARIPVAWYIPPKVWAWKRKRALLLNEYCRRIYTIFPFEPSYFNEKAKWLGNPLVDIVHVKKDRKEMRKFLGIHEEPLLCLAPGSRVQEVRSLFLIYLQAAREIKKTIPDLKIAVPVVKNVESHILQISKSFEDLQLIFVDEDSWSLMNASDLLISTSGTITLEAAILKLPMIICNRASLITWLFFRFLVNLDFIGLPNILANKEICKELLQHDATPEKIADQAIKILKNPSLRQKQIQDLEDLRVLLGDSGVVARVCADIQREFLS